ncbi:MAG TPA: hypothetical protein VIB39_17395 [Candidatus Angelobacter sp.]|jgi:hypothetical protein
MLLKRLMLLVFLASLPMCAQVNNGAIIYADQYTTLTYQQIIDTICPSNGCTIYATSPNASRSIGTVDPGTKVVTIYFGPFTYTIDHMILRKGFRIIGMGASDAGTILQSINASSPMSSLPNQLQRRSRQRCIPLWLSSLRGFRQHVPKWNLA